MDKTLHAIQVVSGVLQGPFDLGNMLLGMKGVMEMMVALCGSDREIDQLVAVEALIHASTKLSRATFIITNGISLLKEIYKKTKNEKIKIRALVVGSPRPFRQSSSQLGDRVGSAPYRFSVMGST